MSTLITRDYCVSSKRTYSTGTFYTGLQGTLQTDPTAENAAQKQVTSGQVRDLRIRVVISGATGETSNVTLLKNGQPTDLTKDIAGDPDHDGETLQNPDDIVSFAQNDVLCWRILAKSSASRLLTLRWIAIKIEDQ